MKKTYIMAVLVLLTAAPVMALSVVGTKHDMVFSGFASAPVGGSTEVCIFCHTPHGGQASVTLAPLWNNTLSGNVATVYNSSISSTMNFVTDVNMVNATDARLCLACHDGSVGMPVNQPNSGDLEVTALAMGANTIISTNLSNDHPIGMDLGATPGATDAGIRTIAVIRGATGFNEDPFYGGVANDNVNIMWCSTCHDVHDNTDVPFLRMNNAGSAMCKACHIK